MQARTAPRITAAIALFLAARARAIRRAARSPARPIWRRPSGALRPSALLRGATPAGGTPTADAIDRAASLLLGVRAASTARALVLATDGAPDCNTGLDPRTCACADTAAPCRRQSSLRLDDDRTVKRIAAQASSGLPTYVIGIQSENDTALTGVLDAMAVAGGRPQSGAAHRYYAVSSESDLDAALVTIRDQVGSRTFLTGSVPGDQGSIVVSLGGVPIPYDPTGVTGWSWSDRRSRRARPGTSRRGTTA